MSRAASALGSRLAALGDPADQALREAEILAALEDETPGVRDVAIAWAARCLEPARLTPLVALPDNAILRNAALAALVRQGPYAVRHVEAMLEDPDPDVVMFACQVLGQIRASESGPALIRLLAHDRVNVVQAAVEALGRVRTREAVPRLIEILGEDPWLQLAATEALGEIRDPLAVPVMLGLVPESFVAEPALEALAKIADPEAAEQLLALLMREDTVELRAPLLRAIAASVRTGMHGLERFKHQLEAGGAGSRIAEYLAAVLQGDDPGAERRGLSDGGDDRRGSRGGSATVRAAAALALAADLEGLFPWIMRWAADRDGVPWLRELVLRFPGCLTKQRANLLAHPDPQVRQGVLEVAEFEAADAVSIIAMVRDDADGIRAAACRALGVLGAGIAVPCLFDRLVHGAGQERDAAAAALGRMPPQDLEPVLGPLVRSPDNESLVLRALRIIEHSGSRSFDNDVQQLAHAQSPVVRRGALRVVAQMEGSRAEVLLFRALADRDETIQTDALELLAKRPGGKTADTLLALLTTNDSLRYHVIRALGRLGAAQAAGPLETLYVAAPFHEKLEIISAIANLAGPGAVDFLRLCLDDPHIDVRRVAAQGLADLVGPADAGLLAGLAQDPDWAIRNEAARGLGRLRTPDQRAVLVNLARDLEPVVARTARIALGAEEPAEAASGP